MIDERYLNSNFKSVFSFLQKTISSGKYLTEILNSFFWKLKRFIIIHLFINLIFLFSISNYFQISMFFYTFFVMAWKGSKKKVSSRQGVGKLWPAGQMWPSNSKSAAFKLLFSQNIILNIFLQIFFYYTIN